MSWILAGLLSVQEKSPVPPEAAVKEAEKLVREIFTDEYAKRSQADRASLARKLLKQSQQSEGDGAALYVLLRDAHEFATEAGDATTSLSALSKLSKAFQVQGLSMRQKALGTLGRFAKTPEEARESVRAHLELADDAFRAEDLEVADKVCDSALAVAKSLKDIPSVARVEAKRREIKEARSGVDKLKAARETLLKSQDDAAANELIGRYECLSRGAWESGLPFLAKAADTELAALAKRDLGSPKETAEQVKLGDAWWDRAEKEAGGARLSIRTRAGAWYTQAHPDLAGLTKVRVEKRLAELPVGIKDPVPPGLVGWWRFDEGSGETAADSSGAGQLANLLNGAHWVPGKIGGALGFDGVDDCAIGTLSRVPAANAPQTLAWFYRLETLPQSGMTFITLCDEPPTSSVQSGIQGNSLAIWKLGARVLVHAPAHTCADWHHYAYTFDGTTHRLYADGVPKETSTHAPQTAVPKRLEFGRWGGGSGTGPGGYFKGALDEIRIYNRPLTEAEVRILAGVK